MAGAGEPANTGREIAARGATAATVERAPTRRLLNAMQHSHEIAAALARRELCDRVPVDDHCAEPVADLCREKANSSCRGQREVALFHSCGSEVEARRLVDDDPRLEFAISDSDAHVRCLRPGGHVPIDTAHVVARHARTRCAGLGAVAWAEDTIVALHHTVELA